MGRAGVADSPHAPPELENVNAVDQRRVVLQLVVVLMINDGALAVAPGRERSQNIYRRRCRHRQLAVALAKILEARLVDDFCAENLGITNLQRVFRGLRVVGLRRKVELPDSVVVLSVAEILVARRQRVVLADLVVETGAEICACPRIGNRLGKGNGVIDVVGVKGDGVDGARSLMFRRSILKKKEAFLLRGPPRFPLYWVES